MGGRGREREEKWIRVKIKRCCEIQKETHTPGAGGFQDCILLIRSWFLGWPHPPAYGPRAGSPLPREQAMAPTTGTRGLGG